MLQSKGRYSLDCINDVTCGSVWGTITTLENIDEAVQQRGAIQSKDRILRDSGRIQRQPLRIFQGFRKRDRRQLLRRTYIKTSAVLDTQRLPIECRLYLVVLHKQQSFVGMCIFVGCILRRFVDQK